MFQHPGSLWWHHCWALLGAIVPPHAQNMCNSQLRPVGNWFQLRPVETGSRTAKNRTRPCWTGLLWFFAVFCGLLTAVNRSRFRSTLPGAQRPDRTGLSNTMPQPEVTLTPTPRFPVKNVCTPPGITGVTLRTPATTCFAWFKCHAKYRNPKWREVHRRISCQKSMHSASHGDQCLALETRVTRWEEVLEGTQCCLYLDAQVLTGVGGVTHCSQAMMSGGVCRLLTVNTIHSRICCQQSQHSATYYPCVTPWTPVKAWVSKYKQ